MTGNEKAIEYLELIVSKVKSGEFLPVSINASWSEPRSLKGEPIKVTYEIELKRAEV